MSVNKRDMSDVEAGEESQDKEDEVERQEKENGELTQRLPGPKWQSRPC